MNSHFQPLAQHGGQVFNILEDIQIQRLDKGHAELSEQSFNLFGDAIRVVFSQISEYLKKISLNHTNCSDLQSVFLELSESIARINSTFNDHYQKTLLDFNKNNCKVYQTSCLYKLLIKYLPYYSTKLTSEKCTKTYSELYLLINYWVYQNSTTAIFFHSKVNFRCVEMVINTLKGGY